MENQIALEEMSLAQLKDIRDRIDDVLSKKEREELLKARSDVIELAASRGFSLQQILNADSVGRAKKVARRYANPANKNQAWSGHGKRPQWVASHLASGGKLADLEVKSDA